MFLMSSAERTTAARGLACRDLVASGCFVHDRLAGTAAGLRAAAGAEIGRGRGRIEPRFGIDEEPARRRHPVAGRQPLEHRVEIVLPRSQFDFDAFEQPLLALDVNDLLRARIDHGLFRHDEELLLRFGRAALALAGRCDERIVRAVLAASVL